MLAARGGGGEGSGRTRRRHRRGWRRGAPRGGILTHGGVARATGAGLGAMAAGFGATLPRLEERHAAIATKEAKVMNRGLRNARGARRARRTRGASTPPSTRWRSRCPGKGARSRPRAPSDDASRGARARDDAPSPSDGTPSRAKGRGEASRRVARAAVSRVRRRTNVARRLGKKCVTQLWMKSRQAARFRSKARRTRVRRSNSRRAKQRPPSPRRAAWTTTNTAMATAPDTTPMRWRSPRTSVTGLSAAPR